jgi:hypothetical protein
MQTIVNGKQYAIVEEIDPSFVTEPNNVFMELVASGVNLYGKQSTKYSIWLVLLVVHNLLPWLMTKKFFILLLLLIPREKAPMGDNINIFLAPLIRDLLTLWAGKAAVGTFDRLAPRHFLMRGVLLWMMNDFPAYGTLSGQYTKGYKRCPECVMKTKADYSNELWKIVYMGIRRWLCPEHRFRRSQIPFDGNQEWSKAPRRPCGVDIKGMEVECADFLYAGRIEDSQYNPVKEHGLKRVPWLYQLPYWAVNISLSHKKLGFVGSAYMQMLLE